jgi:hypothetical protein
MQQIDTQSVVVAFSMDRDSSDSEVPNSSLDHAK